DEEGRRLVRGVGAGGNGHVLGDAGRLREGGRHERNGRDQRPREDSQQFAHRLLPAKTSLIGSPLRELSRAAGGRASMGPNGRHTPKAEYPVTPRRGVSQTTLSAQGSQRCRGSRIATLDQVQCEGIDSLRPFTRRSGSASRPCRPILLEQRGISLFLRRKV